MKKCGKVFLIVLLVVLSIAVLAACNPTGQNNSGGNGDGGQTPPDTSTTTYYLSFQLSQSNYVVGEFSLSDVTAYVMERKDTNGKITTIHINFFRIRKIGVLGIQPAPCQHNCCKKINTFHKTIVFKLLSSCLFLCSLLSPHPQPLSWEAV